jgi:plasmid stability protein
VPAIHIRNVPEAMLSALRERAEAHGRSMQQEVLAILDAATAEPIPRQPPSPIQLVTTRTSTHTTWRREDVYGDEGR